MSVSLELYPIENKRLEEIDTDSSIKLNTDNLLNIKDDTNSVLWEENILPFLFIKDCSELKDKEKTLSYLWIFA